MGHLEDRELVRIIDGGESFEPSPETQEHLAGCEVCRRRLESFRILTQHGTASAEDLAALHTPAIRAELTRLFAILSRKSRSRPAQHTPAELIPLQPILPRNHYRALAADPGTASASRLPVLRSAEGDYVVRFRQEADGRLCAYVIDGRDDPTSQLKLRIGAAGPVFAVGESGEVVLEGVTEEQLRYAVVLIERREKSSS
ncbi:MAG: hypothetical protein GF330_12695 [Candidatus Eisenbacteria bacterium]|nr:hypothetical protein [Candidatus Eisenbacteria bacterium]